MEIENYRGYKIYRNSRSVCHKNPISGHEWTTQEPLKTLSIAGPRASVNQEFKTVKAAREHIDFIIKWTLTT